jgi:cell pole-organizing protein PopZ
MKKLSATRGCVNPIFPSTGDYSIVLSAHSRWPEQKMANSQHEPTMEEILASIRKIISDDASAPPPAIAPEHRAAEHEVLDLTQEVKDPAMPQASAPTSVDASPEQPHPAAQGETPAHVAETESAPPQPEEGIFSEKTRQAFTDAMADVDTETPELVVVAHETHAPAAVGIAGPSVETVFERAVKEAFDPVVQKWLADNNDARLDRMKPVIRDWLDENFPALLEDAIRSELARTTKSRNRR